MEQVQLGTLGDVSRLGCVICNLILYFIARIGVGEVMNLADSPVNDGSLSKGAARGNHINASLGVGGALGSADS